MKRSVAFFLSFAFFLSSFLILYFTPGAVQNLRLNIYNSDHLFPFAFFQGVLTPGSLPDWAFSAYTPYFELVGEGLIYLLTRNIHITIAIFAFLQPLSALAGLLFLGQRVFGKNLALFILLTICVSLSILVFSSGSINFFFYQFVSYGHFGSAVVGLFCLGLLVSICTSTNTLSKTWPSFLGLWFLVAFSVGSDPLFTSQFIVPVSGVLVCLWILKVIPFRKAIYPAVSLLYAAAFGFYLYRLPFFFGGDRVYLFGSNIHPAVDLVIANWGWLVYQFSEFFKNAPWGIPIWVGFYLACLVFSVRIGRNWWQGKRGSLHARILFVLLFFFLQMVANVFSGVLTDNIDLRYMHPILYTPLFWGWPFLAAAVPGWLKYFRGSRALILSLPATALVIIIVMIQAFNSESQPPVLSNYYPEINACFDRETTRLGLHRGISHYWQARPLTLLSRVGLAVVQVSPDLAPFHFLGNSDWYYDDQFDFIVIDHDAPYGHQIDPQLVLNRFGPPAVTITCLSSDILVYNRTTDTAFSHQFASYSKKAQ